MTRVQPFLGELLAEFSARRVLSAVVVVLAAAAMAVSLISAGRGAALAQDVRSRLESVEARTITVNASPADDLQPGMVHALGRISGVQTALAFGASTDVSNAELPGGDRVSARRVWANDWRVLGVPAPGSRSRDLAWADAGTLRKLGVGGFPAQVRATDGADMAVVGRTRASPSMRPVTNGVLVPTELHETSASATSVVVVARRASELPAVERTVRSMLPDTNSPTIKVRLSAELAAASTQVQAVLDAYGRNALASSFSAASGLVAIIHVGIVLMRRQDLGRRRALGATRSMIAALVLGNVLLASTFGVILGVAASVVVLRLLGSSMPPVPLVVALSVLLVGSTSVLSVVPACLAARLNPATEMRVP